MDDDDDMRLYLDGCLHMLGAAVVLAAADGAEAIRLARAEAPHLIISDIVMHGMDGVALCRALKSDARTRGIPLLLVSGETRAPPPCADGFLAKPFNTASLRASIDRLIDRTP